MTGTVLLKLLCTLDFVIKQVFKTRIMCLSNNVSKILFLPIPLNIKNIMALESLKKTSLPPQIARLKLLDCQKAMIHMNSKVVSSIKIPQGKNYTHTIMAC